jgi:hypothetical protein
MDKKTKALIWEALAVVVTAIGAWIATKHRPRR